VIPLVARDQAAVVQDIGDPLGVSDGAPQVEAFPEKRVGLPVFPAGDRHQGQVVQRRRHAPHLAARPADRQALLVQPLRERVIVLVPGQVAGAVQGAGAFPRERAARRIVERAGEPRPSLVDVPVHLPEPPQRRAQTEGGRTSPPSSA
jgi:hypothetical protein